MCNILETLELQAHANHRQATVLYPCLHMQSTEYASGIKLRGGLSQPPLPKIRYARLLDLECTYQPEK